ncbi:FMN-binding negative transcriptional regulator [Aerophototrophica crusticola]|uniref:FMN-binding negative transcriptional regulator n=1 Tax=Aerophototrophica crusticola TaxID=1709002 RepID=A0A858R3M6_9PROT|nr:FMN-binding negative transcriptional regulator [Rhodospirillaceae bacterium B3]
MYTPPHFREDDPAALRAIIRAARLATLVTMGEGGLTATPLPLLAEEGPEGLRLIGHLARANPQWRGFDPAIPALALFQGPEAYVSPSWYATKAETHKVVPTWNYVAVHAYGRLEVVEEPDALHAIVSRLTDHHESGRATPWAVTDAPPDFIRAQLKGIVGVVLHVDRLEGKRKLSQNRNEADRAGVRQGLSASADPRDRAVGEMV